MDKNLSRLPAGLVEYRRSWRRIVRQRFESGGVDLVGYTSDEPTRRSEFVKVTTAAPRP